MLRKWGDIELSKRTIGLLKEIESEIREVMKDFVIQSEDFITEAVPVINTKRMIDLVRLRDEQWFEFECEHSISKDNSYTFYV